MSKPHQLAAPPGAVFFWVFRMYEEGVTARPDDEGGITEDELRAIARQHIRLATDYLEGEIAEERTQAQNYYYAERFGNEQDGRSSFVTSDVQDTIETIMPELMEIFAGSDEPVEFEPVGGEDEQFAKDATAYCSYIWNHDNEGFENTHDVIKDALVSKNGVLAITWDDSEDIDRHHLENITGDHLLQLEADPNVEILEYSPAEDHENYPGVALFDVKVEVVENKGRVKVEVIAPEDFLISPRATSIDTAPMVGARYEKTISELLEEGFDEELLRNIPSHDEVYYNREKQARFRNEETWPEQTTVTSPLTRTVWVYDLYFRCDYDGDGRAELRQVMVAGPAREILINQEVDDHPFVSGSPIRMGHKFFGRSVADLTMDIQFLRSTVTRQLLDNMYLTNNGRAVVNRRINLGDWTANRPGGAVRATGDQPVGDAVMPLITAPLGPTALPILDWITQEKEQRTGQTRYSQGLDAESLNDTATGMNLILGQAQKRTLLIARVLAETVFKAAFRKILKLVVSHQDQPRMIRLRGRPVEMNPAHWNADMDVSINVGLGHGTKDSRLQSSIGWLNIVERMVSFQGGVNGPLITLDNVYKAAVDVLHDTGRKNEESYINDPNGMQMPQQDQPDPEMEKVRLLAEAEMAKAKMEDERRRWEVGLQHERETNKIALQDDRERLKAGLDAEGKMTDAQIKMDSAIEQANKDLDDLRANRAADAEKHEIEVAKMEADLAKAQASVDLDAAKLALEEQKIEAQTAVELEKIQVQREGLAIQAATAQQAQDTESGETKKEGGNGQAGNMTINIDAKTPGKKKMTLTKDSDGNITGAEVE